MSARVAVPSTTMARPRQDESNPVAQAVRDAVAEARQDVAQARADAAQAAKDAAQAGKDAAQAGKAAPTAPTAPTAPAPPGLPGEPKVTINPDGRMVIVSPDGHTTISYPDGRVVHVRPNGEVEESTPPSAFQNVGPEPGEVLSMVGVGALLAFFLGRWWTGRGFRRRAKSEGRMELGISTELADRMDRIEHAVDSVAIEVERISEGQRFTTKLMSEMRAPASATPQLGAGDAVVPPPATARREGVVIPAGERRS